MKIFWFATFIFLSVLTNAHADELKHFEYLDVIGVRYEKSALEKCKEKNYPGAIVQVPCDTMITDFISVTPKLIVKISLEKQQEMGFKGNQLSVSSSRNGATAYWKEGFSPQDIEALQDIKGKQIRLVNVTAPEKGLRGVGSLTFESVIVGK